VYLATERLVLRRFQESDVDNLVELDSDPRVMRYLTGGKPTPRERIQKRVLPNMINDNDRVPGCGCWAAIEKSTGTFIGWFALHAPEGGSGEEAELGYRLRAEAWGKGYATEGSRAVIHKAFTEHGITRVFAQTMAVNQPSRRVMERLGMTHTRTLHLEWIDPLPGTELGEVEYELTKAHWTNGYAPRVSELASEPLGTAPAPRDEAPGLPAPSLRGDGVSAQGPVVILVGPPGSGKTTVGRVLADTLGVPFRDTDADIEATAGKAISAIFTEDGERVFRAHEEEAVARGLSQHAGVLALGGGSILAERTRARLAGHPVVFLNVGVSEGVQRTGLSVARPLLAGVNPRSRFKELLEARLPLYREVATAEVATDGRSPGQVVIDVLNALGLVGTA
jgi:shikimate kinase/RimJ/RimL family protein N-acetyltransferase